MAKVVPSQVVLVIDTLFPFAKSPPADGIRIGAEYSPHLLGVLTLAKYISPSLLQLSGEDYSNLAVGLSGLDYMVRTWESRGSVVDVQQRINGAHPIVLVRQSLAKCPDASPTSTTTELLFIKDDALRDSIRLDISSAAEDLHAGNWKGATVLAGSATEALLLWALQNKGTSPQIAASVAALKISPRSMNPEDWGLEEYIGVTENLNLIRRETAAQARLAQRFRNLIHPGRTARLGLTCDRGTALSALAAMELVARDLK